MTTTLKAGRLTTTAIIPTFNRARYVGACIASLEAQTRKLDQIIVVNDGSTDDTAAVLAGFGTKIEVIEKPNGGKSSALNMALERVRGEAVWIFDDDDLAAPTALATLAEALEATPQAGFSWGLYSRFVGDVPNPAAPPDTGYFDKLPDRRLLVGLLEQNFIMQPGMLARYSCYETVGPFDARLIRSQDYDMVLRLARRFKAVAVERIVFYQRKHQGVRGSIAVSVKAASMDDSWSFYDRMIFSDIHRDYSLDEFAPSGPGGPFWQAEALLHRCCFMARKGLWDLAAGDLKQFSQMVKMSGRDRLTPAEDAVLKRTLYTSDAVIDSLRRAATFQAALASIPTPLQREIRAALLVAFPHLFRRAVEGRSPTRLGMVAAAFISIATLPAAWSCAPSIVANKFRRLRHSRRSAALN